MESKKPDKKENAVMLNKDSLREALIKESIQTHWVALERLSKT
ncbi:hypothetical protein 015DV002_129 [Bacillus phage 015DV002]|nr:hypothetical protein 000TH008_141 [Bacillus phage 000TH008]QQO40835.1 hypothetical protein 000TH009_141 [Bacillus phage 000TH009]QQO41083.1 hypothetical protein 015DV002_129 [Bacillus phage 015DV002]QQO41363.1 hypothetical protein 015DV004_148 [Bacillus phage 015DV004]